MRYLVAPFVLAAAVVLPAADAAEPLVALGVHPSAFSPNGDELKDSVQIQVTAGESGQLNVSLLRHGTALSTLLSKAIAAGEGVSFRWSGCCAASGKRFRDGRYALRATLVPAAGPSATALARLVIDTTPPVVSRPRPSPVRLTRGSLTVRASVHDLMPTVRLRPLLYGTDGERVAAGSRIVVDRGNVLLRWRAVGERLPGAYRVAVAAFDGVGNASVSKTQALLVQHAVRSRVWARFRGVGRHIALTFDDCNFPGAWSSILHTLHRFHVRATFFCPGERVLAEPALARETIAAGDSVGSHGWDHADFSHLSFAAQFSRLERDNHAWWSVARASATPFFRPPYGAYDSSTVTAAGRAGYAAIVLWDVDPRDWSSPGVSAIIDRVDSGTRPGSIVLMHVVPETAAALPTIISRLQARRLRPSTLPELARMGRPSADGWPARGTGH